MCGVRRCIPRLSRSLLILCIALAALLSVASAQVEGKILSSGEFIAVKVQKQLDLRIGQAPLIKVDPY